MQVPGTGQLRRFTDLLSHQAEILRDERKMRHISTHWAVLQPLLAASSQPPDWREFVQVCVSPFHSAFSVSAVVFLKHNKINNK